MPYLKSTGPSLETHPFLDACCLWRNKDAYSSLCRPMIFQSKEFGSKHQISNHLKSRKVDEINIKTGKILSLMIKQ